MRSRLVVIATLLMLLGSAINWYISVQKAHAHIEMSLLHWRQEFKKTNPNTRIQFDGMHFSGFPLSTKIVLVNPALSTIVGNESFAIGFTEAALVESGAEGFYTLVVPENKGRAVYAVNGSAPEEYRVSWDNTVQIMFTAYDKTGVKPRLVNTLPISDIRLILPEKLLLTAQLGTKSQPIRFDYPEIQRRAIGMERAVPADVTPLLQLSLGVLREALVFQ